MTDRATAGRQTPLRDILAYATGDGATSIVMNTIFGFAMLYYTKALGLAPKLAGIAMAVATLWDAVADPIMGHISDNTRSRFGRRHPYMLIGGILTVLGSYAIWSVPAYFRTPELLFWYLVVVNLLLRTGAAVFLVPHGALGFEICTDYNQRSTLQGVRNGFNMAVNLACTVLVWNVFLRNRDGIEGTTIPSNYKLMGLVVAIAALFFVLFVVFATRKYIVDTRGLPQAVGSSLGRIARNLKDILFDPYPRTVFIFTAIVFIGIVLVTSLQMFVYVDFMKFSALERTLVHGSTMVASGLGALLAAPLVRRLDKKPAIYLGMIVGSIANIMLVVLFASGWVPPGHTWRAIPVATCLFLAFHATFFMGTGAATTVSNSMIADVSEICRYRTGVLKDGGYSAMLLFVLKTAISVGLVMCGYCLAWIGYDPEATEHTPEVLQRLVIAAFLGGSVIILVALLSIARYPVNRAYMAQIQAELGERPTAADGAVPLRE